MGTLSGAACLRPAKSALSTPSCPDCVGPTRRTTYQSITAALQGSLRLDPAKIERSGVSGLWGSFDINYALAVETGIRELAGSQPLGGEREAGPNLRRRGVRRGNTNSMRNAADRFYPELAQRIRDNLITGV